MWTVCFAIFTCIGATGALVPWDLPSADLSPVKQSATFDWDSIPSLNRLSYTTCYSVFECARLSVPLDWHNSTSPNNISLAIIRLPAKVTESDPKHGGTVILNPGGPGGSGVQYALSVAQRIQTLLDGPRHYEILSWDPRAVSFSKPNAFCFEHAVDAALWRHEQRAAGSLDSSDYALRFNWAAEKAHGELCADIDIGVFEDGENIRQHMSTASVARDLLAIVDRVEEHKLIGFQTSQQFVLGSSEHAKPGKLQYIGTSYGTFLGQVFAAMYPDRVQRMILDSNIDGDNWTSRDEASIDDAIAIREYFYETCFQAKSGCALYRPYDHSAQDVKARFQDLLEDLEKFPSYSTHESRVTLVTRGTVQQGMFTSSYQPLIFFAPYAKFLHDLINNVDPGFPFWQAPGPEHRDWSERYLGGDIGPTTHCSDGPDLTGEGIDGFKNYLQRLIHRFGSAGALQAEYKIPCWGWPASLRTKWRYEGPFNSSVPILFLNNRLDPATPAKNARRMAEHFNGSVMLTQDSVGHGTLWPPSNCVWKYMKDYMQNGEMPAEGIVCQPRCRPFDEQCAPMDAEKLFPPW